MDDDEALVVLTDQEDGEAFNADEDVRRAALGHICRARSGTTAERAARAQAVFAEMMFFSEEDAEAVRVHALAVAQRRNMPSQRVKCACADARCRARRRRCRWPSTRWRPRAGRRRSWMTTRARAASVASRNGAARTRAVPLTRGRPTQMTRAMTTRRRRERRLLAARAPGASCVLATWRVGPQNRCEGAGWPRGVLYIHL